MKEGGADLLLRSDGPDDLVAFLEEEVDDVDGDEAGSAGDEDLIIPTNGAEGRGGGEGEREEGAVRCRGSAHCALPPTSDVRGRERRGTYGVSGLRDSLGSGHDGGLV